MIDMNREQLISKMFDMANKLLNNWAREGENAIWKLCIDWNMEHPDEEIFMCEYQSDDSEYVNGFMIEDDWWVFEK